MYKFPLLSFIAIFSASVILISNLRPSADLCLSPNRSSCKKAILVPKESPARCSEYNWKLRSANTDNDSLPIYDFIIFSKEFDTLEIRLFELYDYVTLFFIAESAQTLTGQDKPLYLKENWSRFAKYHDKIRRLEVKLVHNVSDPWDNEHRMRDEGLPLAQESITDHSYLLLASDADEIPKARFMQALRECQLPSTFRPLVLDCAFYYYSYEFRSEFHKCRGSSVTRVFANQSKQLSGNALRNARFSFHLVPHSCYHCTWCFDQIKEVRFKMASYSHTEHNQLRFRTREHIVDRFRTGKDLFDRPGESYTYVENNLDYPRLIKAQPDRFLYMTKRANSSNAGFIDI